MTDTLRAIPAFGSAQYRYRRKAAEVLSGLCHWTARRRWPGLTAVLIAALMIRVQKAKAGGAEARSIVVLPKAGLIEDIAASFGDDDLFNVTTLDRTITKALSTAFLAHINDDNSYLGNAERDAPAKAALRSFWVATLKQLMKYRRIDAFMTGNFSYHAEQELAAAASELGVAFVVLHKECRKTPRLADFYLDVYRDRKGPFKGSHVLIYNEIEKNIQIGAGVVPGEMIDITGMPRMDIIHRRRRREAASWTPPAPTSRPTILFFSVFERYGLPFVRRVIDGKSFDEEMPAEVLALNWSSLMSTLHHSMVEIATANPDIDVIIKTKGDPVADDTLRRMFGAVLQLPDNVRLVSGGDPLDLIFASDVACGFNTTAVLESIAADVPTVVPLFAEAVDERMAGFVMDFGDAAVSATSPEHLIESLVELARRRRGKPALELGPTQQEILVHWVGNADGLAGQRVRDAVFEITNAAV